MHVNGNLMINAWPLQRQLQLFMLHLLTINKMPQRPRHRSNPSQASVVRVQRPGKGPLEVEGSQSRTRLICGYRPADGCLEKRGVGEGEEEIEQKQDKLQTHTSLFFFIPSIHVCDDSSWPWLSLWEEKPSWESVSESPMMSPCGPMLPNWTEINCSDACVCVLYQVLGKFFSHYSHE